VAAGQERRGMGRVHDLRGFGITIAGDLSHNGDKAQEEKGECGGLGPSLKLKLLILHFSQNWRSIIGISLLCGGKTEGIRGEGTWTKDERNTGRYIRKTRSGDVWEEREKGSMKKTKEKVHQRKKSKVRKGKEAQARAAWGVL